MYPVDPLQTVQPSSNFDTYFDEYLFPPYDEQLPVEDGGVNNQDMDGSIMQSLPGSHLVHMGNQGHLNHHDHVNHHGHHGHHGHPTHMNIHGRLDHGANHPMRYRGPDGQFCSVQSYNNITHPGDYGQHEHELGQGDILFGDHLNMNMTGMNMNAMNMNAMNMNMNMNGDINGMDIHDINAMNSSHYHNHNQQYIQAQHSVKTTKMQQKPQKKRGRKAATMTPRQRDQRGRFISANQENTYSPSNNTGMDMNGMNMDTVNMNMNMNSIIENQNNSTDTAAQTNDYDSMNPNSYFIQE